MQRLAALLAPDRAAGLFRQAAQLASGAHDGTAALALRRQAHALVPATGDELAELALSLYAGGSHAEALPLLAAVVAALDQGSRPAREAEVLLAHADLLAESGDLAQAETALRRLADRPDAPASAVERLAELRARTDPREAIELLAAYQLRQPPSEEVGRALLKLGERARAELADPELTERLLLGAASALPDPLVAHQARAALHRETGRSGALLSALQATADAALRKGDVALGSSSLEEVAEVASRSDRADEALEALSRLRSTLESAGRKPDAAAVERRRASLFLEVRGDATAASAALARAFELAPDVDTAAQLADLAARRGDTRARAGWLRGPSAPAAGEAAAAALVQVAELHAGRSATRPRPSRSCATRSRRCRVTRAEALLVAAPGALRPRRGPGRVLRRRRPEPHRGRRAGAPPPPGRGAVPRAGKAEPALDALSAAHGFARRCLHHRRARRAPGLPGQDADAAPFDALLLQGDPFHPAYDVTWPGSRPPATGGPGSSRGRPRRAAGGCRGRPGAGCAPPRPSGRVGARTMRAPPRIARSIRLPSSTCLRRTPCTGRGDVRALAELLGSAPGRFPPRRPRCWPSVPSS
jgi:tetratricopeptide (TPR) repeat protein